MKFARAQPPLARQPSRGEARVKPVNDPRRGGMTRGAGRAYTARDQPEIYDKRAGEAARKRTGAQSARSRARPHTGARGSCVSGLSPGGLCARRRRGGLFSERGCGVDADESNDDCDVGRFSFAERVAEKRLRTCGKGKYYLEIFLSI